MRLLLGAVHTLLRSETGDDWRPIIFHRSGLPYCNIKKFQLQIKNKIMSNSDKFLAAAEDPKTKGRKMIAFQGMYPRVNNNALSLNVS